MFVGGEAELKVGLSRAKAGLAGLAGAGWLIHASRHAYREGIRGLAESGLFGAGQEMAGLAEVHIREQGPQSALAGLALRWDVIGPGGQSFPALDADIVLSRSGEHATALTITGVYRLPAGITAGDLDQATVQHTATVTIQTFLGRLAWALTAPVHVTDPGRTPGEGQPPPSAAQPS